ncbi:MAG: hypothetical protein KKA55_10780 [Proteobacteria bacterium]|nr:hypothetical protein [Pseudomonadota bacterium]MBU1596002.1 hypothetical protein [Pseudomonadota bacterium]
MRTRLNVFAVCLLLVLVLPSFSLAQDSQEPTEISAGPGGLVLDGWEMVLPDIEGQYKRDPSRTVFVYRLKDGTVKKYAMKPPPTPPFMWNKKGTDRLLFSPPGYPKYYTQKLIDWWSKGGRGDFLNQNGAWVGRSNAAVSSVAPPTPEIEGATPPAVLPEPSPQAVSKDSKEAIRAEYFRRKAVFEAIPNDDKHLPEKSKAYREWTEWMRENASKMK